MLHSLMETAEVVKGWIDCGHTFENSLGVFVGVEFIS